MARGQGTSDEIERRAGEALPLLEAAGDDDGLAYVWFALTRVAHQRAQHAEWVRASERADEHARRAGHAVQGGWLFATPFAVGPWPASEALAKLEALSPDQPHPGDLLVRGVLLAMLDRIDEAWEIALSAAERGREFGFTWAETSLDNIAEFAGDLEARESYLRQACEKLEASGRLNQLSTYAPRLGRVLCERGRYDEAEELARKGKELGVPEDVVTQFEWRRVEALVRSARAEHAEAELLAREAARFAFETDSPVWQGQALCDLGEVLEAAGRRDEAVEALEQALECYERKEIVPLARRVRERLAALQEAPA
jgi:tetratricopeptide (TPR) repeat protein